MPDRTLAIVFRNQIQSGARSIPSCTDGTAATRIFTAMIPKRAPQCEVCGEDVLPVWYRVFHKRGPGNQRG